MVGGMLIPVNIYHAILNDNSHGRQVTEQLVMDHVFQTIGQIERQLKSDVKNVFNPIFWLKFIFVKVIRFPFVVLSFTGFDIKKIEDHLISKVVKCVEVALLVWIFLRFGFSFDQIAGLFKGFISR